MADLADECIDVIVTSPPYNRNKKYSSDSDERYNDKQPECEYLSFLRRVWKECYRVAKTRAVFFLNIGDSAEDQGISEKVVNSAVDAGWIRVQDIVWVKSIYGKGHYTPTGNNKRFHNVWEHIFMLVKDEKEYSIDPKAIGIPYADKSNIGRYSDSDLRDPGNVFHIVYEKTTGATIKKGHDAPFPIGLPYMCIKAVPYCETVLDPFLGTGTTLAASNSLQKKGYGYEKYPRTELIKDTIRDGKLYAPQVPILIPHYESSIKLLLDLFLEQRNEHAKKRLENKNQQICYDILMDTLKKMKMAPDTLRSLEEAVEIPEDLGKPNPRKIKALDQFVEKSK